MVTPEPSLNDVLIGIARIEEKLVALTDKLEKLEDQTDEKFKRLDGQVDLHTKKLSEHDQLLTLLKEKAPMRVNVWTVVLGVTSLVTVVLLVLDRIFKA
jgi:hypothetical protein